MLIDSALITVRSGKGGDGVVAFRREKYINKGGPKGGDGGRGGDVVLEASPGVDTLLDFKGRHHYHAQEGEAGRAKQQHGADGEDLVIRVPVGTLVYRQEVREAAQPWEMPEAVGAGELLVDLAEADERVVVARGGKGGWGNEHFKSSTNQTPREATPGEAGEELTLRLELKLLADVGLVGKPNAGKSTLLSRVSRATPKVADYPFTTLEPHLGIAELGGGAESARGEEGAGGGDARRLVVADIPGLIEGAHEGTGLGIRFLRHVERTAMLVHVLDVDPTDGSDPIANYRAIRRELERYASVTPEALGVTPLHEKPEVIALNKVDLLGELDGEDVRAAVELVEAELGLAGGEVYPISAATGAGLDKLLERCWGELKGSRERKAWREV